MKRFKNILLVHGQGAGVNATMKRAVSLAKKNRAQLTVLEITEELPREIRMLSTVMSPQEIERRVIKERREHIERLIAPFREEGLRVNVNILTGTSFLKIIQEVLRKKHDLVFMTAEGKGGLKSRLFGSTSLHLMRKCPCPVWVIKPVRRKRYARILAAVDPDTSNEERNALNIQILELATSLARLEQSELHFVHVWSPWGKHIIQDHLYDSQMAKEELRQLTQEILAQHKKQFRELLDICSLEGLTYHVHFLVGEARTVIPRLASSQQIELIVMGTICRTGLPGFFIGNTAENVLQQVDCSVLTVKPGGFVSPVKLGDA
jgi:nucleotide-binding universal stress UspA family protein